MKKAYLTGLVALAFAAGSAMAETSGSSMPAANSNAPATSMKSSSKSTGAKTGAKKAQAERGKVMGTIDMVDTAGNKIDLKTKDGVKHFMLSAKTKVFKNGAPAATTDLTNGANVKSLRYDKKTNEAVRIDLGA